MKASSESSGLFLPMDVHRTSIPVVKCGSFLIMSSACTKSKPFCEAGVLHFLLVIMLIFQYNVCIYLYCGDDMRLFLIPVIFLVIILLVILAAYICYRIAFYVPPRRKVDPGVITVPPGAAYEPFHEQMVGWIKEIRGLPQKQLKINSVDGLTLYGKYFEFAPGAPVELMFHGYRGNAERDLSGGVQRCFQLGRSALVVDQRCSGFSDGNAITFGVKEHLDCLQWINFMIDYFGPDVKIILTGISMGAATVLMAAGKELPQNVIGVLADCGYNSSKDIMYEVIRKMKLPPRLCYPFVKLGAKMFAHFDPDQWSPEEAVRHCKVPVIFFHGEDDGFVPCRMSRINFDACVSRKELVIVPGADHGLSYPVAPDRYLKALWTFFGPEASHESVWQNYLL